MSDVVAFVRRHRVPFALAFDASAWVVSFLFFAWLRYDNMSTTVPWAATTVAAVAVFALYVVLATVFRLHQGRAGTGSLEQMILLGAVTIISGAALFVVNVVGHWIPRSVPVGGTLGALVLMAWGRAFWRRLRERDLEQLHRDGACLALLVGAGEAGRELVNSMLRDPARRWRPVGILDDDPRKRHLRIRGVPVIGTTSQLEEQVAATGADTVVLAMPSASSEDVDRVRAAAVKAGADVKVLPSTTQLLTERVGIRDLRDINITDVLGRNQLDTDVDAIADYLTGRRVLVTGAGGSIGSELCRQIHRFAPGELMMLDRDESALHALQLSIHGRALLDSDEVILCDIRDAAAVDAIFQARRPEVVFHAAALKHLPMLEQYPAEAVKTNVIGTRNMLESSDRYDVDKFVNISTDKAANPTSVLGYSKRIAERLTAEQAYRAQGTYLSVRFGNVLGSRGSVLTSFAKQIAEGGPITVTDPEVTRFFMTIEEACQLVIQAAAIGGAGEVLVLDMGEPVRIVDMAQQLIEQSGENIRIEYTGLREGEKMHEELFAEHEPQDHRPRHPLVSHVPVPPVTAGEVQDLPTTGERQYVMRALMGLCQDELVPADDEDYLRR
ncbi:polysaccharide biosynthesis protein [Nocardioides abyssi]|uniref:Nucleoside-diphosphate sugar epimerase/dehydratase n=1 Tax=Nocardioides abyssi TaxID=3058370 RepID=A0ABT8EWM7_9ACTN|nr:nucleoside-diphosphate sugar epimerase/dehydratase [Nocardioides abyssi]MDN4162484.1 nucleoside-diphosphate sugar epimerase/dehydratase [Nocardioides abyssi]